MRLLLLADMALAFALFILSAYIRHRILIDIDIRYEDAAYDGIAFAIIVSVSNYAMGVYHSAPKGTPSLTLNYLALRIVAAFALAFICMVTIFYVLPGLLIWRSTLLIAMTLSAPSLIILRWVFLRLIDPRLLEQRIIVIGTGNDAVKVQDLEGKPRVMGFHCTGFVRVSEEDALVDPHRVLPSPNSWLELVNDKSIEEIVIADPNWREHISVDQLLDCRLSGTPISNYTTFCERQTGSVDLDEIDPEWFLFSPGFSRGRVHDIAKRVFDIIVASTVLILFLPVMVATAFAILVESGRPIFYRQERVGSDGSPFIMMKFRSMRRDAEQEGPQWATEVDARTTYIGRFIRRTRIDELPQIFNVLLGHMSFVGPRPERPHFVQNLTPMIPYYNERHRIKPGVTGWAQINYPYGASIEDAKMKLQYDIYYMKHHSVVLDIIILFESIRVILWTEGAR